MRHFSPISATLFTLSLLPQLAFANWQLVPTHSSLNFVTVKNQLVAEIQQFKSLSGSWQDDGKLQVQIDVNSLDTHIPIRNERMLDMLFQQKEFPTISASAMIPAGTVENLAIGDSLRLDTELSLTLLNQTQTLPVAIQISKLSKDRLEANTLAPILVNAAQFKLDGGIAKLQEVAKLQHISSIVPVTFSVRLQR